MSAMKPDAWIWVERVELLNGNEVEQFERVEVTREKPLDEECDQSPLYTLATVRKWLEEEPSVAMKESALNSTFGDFDKLYRAMLSAKLLEMEGGE